MSGALDVAKMIEHSAVDRLRRCGAIYQLKNGHWRCGHETVCMPEQYFLNFDLGEAQTA